MAKVTWIEHLSDGSDVIEDPQTALLVTGKTTSELTFVTGYYHYDKEVDKHYICSEERLFRYEVSPETIKFATQ
jgi:hypothetical protein